MKSFLSPRSKNLGFLEHRSSEKISVGTLRDTFLPIQVYRPRKPLPTYNQTMNYKLFKARFLRAASKCK